MDRDELERAAADVFCGECFVGYHVACSGSLMAPCECPTCFPGMYAEGENADEYEL